jgi:hypothetical protein
MATQPRQLFLCAVVLFMINAERGFRRKFHKDLPCTNSVRFIQLSRYSVIAWTVAVVEVMSLYRQLQTRYWSSPSTICKFPFYMPFKNRYLKLLRPFVIILHLYTYRGSNSTEVFPHRTVTDWIIRKRKIKQSKAVTLHSRRRLGAERRHSSYSFLTSALDRGEWSASRPGRVLPPGNDPRYP